MMHYKFGKVKAKEGQSCSEKNWFRKNEATKLQIWQSKRQRYAKHVLKKLKRKKLVQKK